MSPSRVGQRNLPLVIAVVVLVFGAFSCSGDDEARTTTSSPTGQDFSVPGPYTVGATRLTLDDGRPVEVLYPAATDGLPPGTETYGYTMEEVWGPLITLFPADEVAAAEAVQLPGVGVDLPADGDGPFPVVVVSHGWGTKRFTHVDHAAHLASWGLVVALPEHTSRNLQTRLGGGGTWTTDAETVLETVDRLAVEGSEPDALLAGVPDTERVAVEGQSAGGHDALVAAYDERVDTWIGLAPAIPFPDGLDSSAEDDPETFDLDAFLAETAPPDKPSMTLLAEDDHVLDGAERRAVFDWLAPPKRLVVLADTGHSVFLIDCQGIQEHGGSVVADQLGLAPDSIERRTLEDGCLPDDAPASQVQATWNHLAIAHLRQVFGIDPDVAAASLEPSYLDATFPGRVAAQVDEGVEGVGAAG